MNTLEASTNTTSREADFFKITQAVYHVLTGKKEQITRTYKKPYVIDFNTVKQLHSKLIQTTSQWNRQAIDEALTVFHTNASKHQYSSFARFEQYDLSQTSPIESIFYDLNILIRPNYQNEQIPESLEKKHQHYVVRVRMVSQLALFERMDMSIPPPKFIRFFTNGNIVAEIEFIDYVLAKTLENAVDSWAQAIPLVQSSDQAEKIQKHTHHIPITLQAICFLIACWSFFVLSQNYVVNGDLISVAQFGIVAFAFILSVSKIAFRIGKYIERKLDSLIDISYISINVGDQRLAQKFQTKNKKNIAKAAIALVGNVCLAVGIDYLASQIAHLFL